MDDEMSMSDIQKALGQIAQLLVNKHEKTSEFAASSLNAIEVRIQEFHYDVDNGSTFDRWWNRHEDIFEIDLKEWDEVKKIRFLMRHVHMSVERTFTDSIAPTKWTDMTLETVTKKMLTLFGDNTSTFDRRRTMLDLKMSRENIDDVRVLAARVNKTVENAQVQAATVDEWKVLTFLHALDLPRYSDVHLKMMQTAKQKGKDCTLEDLLTVFNDLSQLKKDSRTITDSTKEVNFVQKEWARDQRDSREQRKGAQKYDNKSAKNTYDKTYNEKYDKSYKDSSCTRCGRRSHSEKDCYRQRMKCFKCDTKGHIADECLEEEDDERDRERLRSDSVRVSTVKEKAYCIDVQINGMKVNMDVDTGSDITFISKEAWRSIGVPKCRPSKCEPICANNERLEIFGKFNAELEYGETGVSGVIYVAATSDRVIIGRDLINQLNVLRVRTEYIVKDQGREVVRPRGQEMAATRTTWAGDGRHVQEWAGDDQGREVVRLRGQEMAATRTTWAGDGRHAQEWAGDGRHWIRRSESKEGRVQHRGGEAADHDYHHIAAVKGPPSTIERPRYNNHPRMIPDQYFFITSPLSQ